MSLVGKLSINVKKQNLDGRPDLPEKVIQVCGQG